MNNQDQRNTTITLNLYGILFFLCLLIVSNLMIYYFVSKKQDTIHPKYAAGMNTNNAQMAGMEHNPTGFYLMHKAALYVQSPKKFEKKIKKVSRKLDIPAEWLMAVIYAESKFDASAVNHMGSGSVGLVQLEPNIVQRLDITVERFKNLNHIEQLDYIQRYFDKVRQHYGEFSSLTDLYLAVTFPEGLGQEYCYTFGVKPSKEYNKNEVLDENKDGTITVKDIDNRMKRMFKTAYLIDKSEAKTWFWSGWL